MVTTPVNAMERVRAAIWGHLVGDAIGVPYEGRPPDPARVVEVRQYGTHHQPAGTWSDDGALTLAMLDSLTAVKFDPDDQAQRMLSWFDEGTYTPDGDGPFDIGVTTRAALDRLRRGTPAIDAGGDAERDQGNGSLMRILPVALVGTAQDGVYVERAHLASRVTHASPICQVACALYVLIVRELVADPAVAADNMLIRAVARLRAVYARMGAGQLLVGARRLRNGQVVQAHHRASRPARPRHRYDRGHRRGPGGPAMGPERHPGRVDQCPARQGHRDAAHRSPGLSER